MQAKLARNRLLFFLLCSVASAAVLQSAESETSVKSSVGTANHRDWLHFNPQKFTPPERLIPAASVAPAKSGSFEKTPSFPHDPTHANVIYGRGKDELPTAIYAKAFDVLDIAGKLFQAPGAGEVKQISVNGQAIALYGTTVYTPLPSSTLVANPVQVKPFEPSRIFYKDKDLWPAVIYAEPGKEIVIANQKFVVPPAGQSLSLVFDASGHLKSGGQNSQKSSNASTGGDSKSGDQDKSPTSGGSSPSAAEKASADKTAAANAASEKAAADKAASDKAAAEKAAADKAAADKAAADKAAADKAAADKAAADKAAADKAAADKAAADKAAADKAAADKAAADKLAAEKAASEQSASGQSSARGGGAQADSAEKLPATFNGGLDTGQTTAFNTLDVGSPPQSSAGDTATTSIQRYNLAGEWTTKNTTTSNTFKLRIDYSAGTYITAVIVDQGSGYLPAGQVRFKGDYISNPFQVTVQRAYVGYTNPYWESGTLTVLDASNITIVAKTGNLLLSRYASPPQTASSNPVSSPSSINLQPAPPKPPVSTSTDPSRPKAATGRNRPEPEFFDKMVAAYDRLPEDVKRYLREAGYTIEIGYDEFTEDEKTSFAWTDKKNKVIHVTMNAFVNGMPAFIEDTYKIDVSAILLHEIGHVWDFYKNYSTDPGFIEAWKSDLQKIKDDPILQGLKSGDSDGQSNYSNENIREGSATKKGLEESAAELVAKIFGANETAPNQLAKVAKNSYEYLMSKEKR